MSTSPVRRTMLGVLLLVSPWFLVQGWVFASGPTPNHVTMPECPDNTGNCAALGEGVVVRMDASLPIVVDASVSVVWAAWEAWQDEEGLRFVSESSTEEGERFGHSIAITPFWRFVDDVVVQFEPLDENRTLIHLYSSSRLGQSDLGVNPDRLLSLHTALVAV